ncbi:MAG TPA: type I-E CRISPR-associated protein Cas7/Cse4/CasC, partial [Anaerolineaceae bacterium]|nr:type I-E CRISPR-associated protein Cas7/Cse4/CasC [Anaerolineaceae bacterium]
MFVEIHIVQSFAPSNLNRDDTGNPKDTEFGGVRRARISSQCIKRSIRMHPAFSQATEVDLGVRTRWITRLLVPPLLEAGKPESEVLAVATAFATQYSKMDKEHTSVLIYLSRNEIQAAIQGMLKQWAGIVGNLQEKKNPELEAVVKELFKQVKNRTGAPDIALFGRMLAEKPELNLDAACQVAHAISTHRVNMEIDFFTAVDDLAREDPTNEGGLGAGMMGVIPFNSACFYRYARLDWELLLRNLG